MTKVAIVEDETEQAEQLKDYLARYGKEKHLTFKVDRFPDAVTFLESYASNYHIVFMDIKMPYLNGMEAAHKLRDLDETVALIFITSLKQYAIKGYEVGAMEYIVKPIEYYNFALKLSKTLKRIQRDEDAQITLVSQANIVRLNSADVLFLETKGHTVIYHTLSGNYTEYNSLTVKERQLGKYGFVRCNSCYLVNLQHVDEIKGYTVVVNGTLLQISQPRKKAFLHAYETWRK